MLPQNAVSAAIQLHDSEKNSSLCSEYTGWISPMSEVKSVFTVHVDDFVTLAIPFFFCAVRFWGWNFEDIALHINWSTKKRCFWGFKSDFINYQINLNTYIDYCSKTNQMHQFLKIILFWNSTLHVSGGLSVHLLQNKINLRNWCISLVSL